MSESPDIETTPASDERLERTDRSDRHGATTADAAGYDLDGQPICRESVPEITADALPMLVWLRGDESYCGDFCLDADQVMVRLGIKRSRLTQISGRELRVGRMRMG